MAIKPMKGAKNLRRHLDTVSTLTEYLASLSATEEKQTEAILAFLLQEELAGQQRYSVLRRLHTRLSHERQRREWDELEKQL